MVLAPGHFHAALVQKYMYEHIDPNVYVFAPDDQDVIDYMEHIDAFNSRDEKPTNWQQKINTGPDFLERMIRDKPGNAVIIAGKNAMKARHILAAVQAGIHVLADKPMAIQPEDMPVLKKAFELAEEKGLLVYDIMTERYEITTILQRELSQIKAVFGELKRGTIHEPAVVKESVHHFFKYVSGNPIRRPAWYFDVEQQGEGIVDVSTHLVDLVFWGCFPEERIDFEKDIEIVAAHRWSTELSFEQFERVTNLTSYPEFLQKDIMGTILKVSANGEITFRLKGIYAKISVIWNYEAPKGTGDTHYSMMRGTRSDLVIRQGDPEGYIPTLYIEPDAALDLIEFKTDLINAFTQLQMRYPGITFQPGAKGWQINIPEEYRMGHEAHFTQVTEKYLEYLGGRPLPGWEVPNMLAKYYMTTKACEMSRSKVTG